MRSSFIPFYTYSVEKVPFRIREARLARTAAAPLKDGPLPCIIGFRLRWSSLIFTSIAVSQSTFCSSTFSFSAPVTSGTAHQCGPCSTVGDHSTVGPRNVAFLCLHLHPGPTPQYRPYFPTAANSTPGPLLMTSWAVSVRLAHLLQKHARSPPAHTVPRARGATEPPLCRCTAANGGA